MMIAGFILHQLTKKIPEAEIEAVNNLMKNERDSEKTFVSKYSEWTKEISRGGLKIPSDIFFLFIRECEICVRKNISESDMAKDSYITAKEIIMDDILLNSMEKNLCQDQHHNLLLKRVLPSF
jgi:hypothetical protein